MSRKTNVNAWNKPVYSLNLTCLCSDRFIITLGTQQCSQVYTRTWHWAVHSGLHSYLTLSRAFRFTLIPDTQQCIQVYTHTWHSAVHSGLHSCLTLSCAFRFTLVFGTQQCSLLMSTKPQMTLLMVCLSSTCRFWGSFSIYGWYQDRVT